MSKFRTPRLLLEIRRNGRWKAVKIYCDYKSVRSFLDDFLNLSIEYKIAMKNMRVKNLLTTRAIADAKQEVYDNKRRKKK